MTRDKAASPLTEELVREFAREFVERGGKPGRVAGDDSTLLALDGDALLAVRLARKPTERESIQFWDEVESALGGRC